MKLETLVLVMIIVALCLPLGVSAKGKPKAADTVMLKDANGAEIGRVIGMENVSWPYVLTDQGYRTLFRIGTGMIYADAFVVFESTDCSGDAYVSKRQPGTVFMPTIEDSLAYDAAALLYSPNDAQGVTINANSAIDSDLSCIPFMSNRESYPAYPNDPDITGIQNTAYPARMVLE